MQQNAFFPPLSFHFSSKDETILPRWQPEMIADREGKNFKKKKKLICRQIQFWVPTQQPHETQLIQPTTRPCLSRSNSGHSNASTERKKIPPQQSRVLLRRSEQARERLRRKNYDQSTKLLGIKQNGGAKEAERRGASLKMKQKIEREREHQTMKMEQSY